MLYKFPARISPSTYTTSAIGYSHSRVRHGCTALEAYTSSAFLIRESVLSHIGSQDTGKHHLRSLPGAPLYFTSQARPAYTRRHHHGDHFHHHTAYSASTKTTTMTTPDHPERAALLTISPVGTHIRPPPPPPVLSPFITPDAHLFQTIHMGPAHVSLPLYRLIIAGDPTMIPHPQSLTLAALQALCPSTTVTAFHECYGPPTAPPTKNHWRVGNVRWTGVPLCEVLRVAGVSASPSGPSSSPSTASPTSSPDESSLYIHATGLDSGTFSTHTAPSYTKDIPLSQALDPAAGVLLAWAMNDHPLTRERGWPLRLVVPGWFGTNAVKWLCRLEVRRGRAQGVFTRVLYNREVEEVVGEEGGEGDGVEEGMGTRGERKKQKVMRPVWRVEVNSLITTPAEGQVAHAAAAGPAEDGKEGDGGEVAVAVAVEGWAWACEGVAGVQVSVDEEGRAPRWVECAVEKRVEFSWQRFRGQLRLTNGSHCVMARARTASGQEQALEGQRNHVHRVRINVV